MTTVFLSSCWSLVFLESILSYLDGEKIVRSTETSQKPLVSHWITVLINVNYNTLYTYYELQEIL